MQKRVIMYIILFLFWAYSVASATVSDLYMTTGQNVTVNGKLIVFLFPIQNGNTVFSVDGEWVKVPLNKTVFGNGAKITLKEADSNYAIATIDVEFACGNSVCESAEAGGGSCCKDCGCLSGYLCVENRCVISSQNACASDRDCDDNNLCTKDTCSGAPRSCINTPISTCSNSDGCCLNNCNVYNDNDCLVSCVHDSQCEDNNPCTIDKCNERSCTNLNAGGCNIDGACIKNTTTTQGSYCFNSVMALQKRSNEACEYDFECVSYDCRGKRCRGDEPPAEGTKKAENPISTFFYENNNAYLYLILGFAVFVILIEVRKFIKDKKEGY